MLHLSRVINLYCIYGLNGLAFIVGHWVLTKVRLFHRLGFGHEICYVLGAYYSHMGVLLEAIKHDLGCTC